MDSESEEDNDITTEQPRISRAPLALTPAPAIALPTVIPPSAATRPTVSPSSLTTPNQPRTNNQPMCDLIGLSLVPHLVTYFGLAGGLTVKESVWRIMSKLLTNPLAKQINWRGVNGKFGFEQLAIKDVVLKNCGKTFFNGIEDHLVPFTSQLLLDSNLFRAIGRMIGHLFLHGGPLLTKDELAVVELEDCPDTDVIGRREKQIRQGLKDTGVLRMIKERPCLIDLLFPRASAQMIEPEMIFDRIIWPTVDSDDEEYRSCCLEDTYRLTGFLRQYIENGTSEELKQQFWGPTGLGTSSSKSVSADVSMPTASTSRETIKLPAKYSTYEGFHKDLKAAVSSTESGVTTVLLPLHHHHHHHDLGVHPSQSHNFHPPGLINKKSVTLSCWGEKLFL
ncbi:Arginine-glutamic acid dipeptide repeats protein [Labeo rohita]|uniref:Arginine-glutamic acid dipeptide repeats protein n=1 Tax=Labeo rohita TaxID=84645 RepID=A0ABQ8L164_LABRO|nr:Arginine-glutamic acid dipeptide repeats protein [Labeo rohita]